MWVASVMRRRFSVACSCRNLRVDVGCQTAATYYTRLSGRRNLRVDVGCQKSVQQEAKGAGCRNLRVDVGCQAEGAYQGYNQEVAICA